MSLSRAGVSQSARVGHELFQHLLQPARRAHATTLFASGKPGALRSSELDDHGKNDLVHRRTSLRNPAHFIADTHNGKEPHPRRSPHDAGRDARPPKEIIRSSWGAVAAATGACALAITSFNREDFTPMPGRLSTCV